ncbi:MAG: TolC family protein, partial [Thermodesulfobacteriota bacterium]
ENKTVLDYFKDVSWTNYGLDVSELDELVRAQKSSAAASLGLLRIEDMREAAVARLNTLLDRPPDTPIARAADLDPAPFDHRPEDLYEWAARYNEDVKIAGLEVEKGDLERRLAGYSWMPDFRVGLTYSQIGEPPAAIPDAGDDALVVSLGMTIPIWFSKNRAAVDEKGFALEGRLAERSAVVTEVVSSVKRTYFDMRTSRMVMDLYGGRLIPEAKKSVDFAEARYKTGKEMLARLLEAQSMWINFRLVYFRAVADYYKSIAELERLAGRELLD